MGRLTIQEIAKVLVVKNGLEQSVANRFTTELFAIIQECLENNDQVKVKGLGTWKVITVEARESISVRTGGRVMIDEHSKITFTPDVTMKELVNKPFSQFETVVLNDNVDFDDLKEQPADAEFEDMREQLAEEELEQFDKQEQTVEAAEKSPEVTPEETAEEILGETAEVTREETTEKKNEEKPQEVLSDNFEETPVIVLEEASEETSGSVTFDEETHDEDDVTNLSKWLWIAFGVLCLMILSGFGGYHLGRQQMTVIPDTIVIKDTVCLSHSQDSVSVGNSSPVVEETPNKVEDTKIEESKAEKSKMEKSKDEAASEVDKYAAKDERVRLGAYRIVGLDHEVTVLQGQTFYSICRAHLGPDMECYIEVYNNMSRNPEIKAGQIIKIPKLQLKKRKKQ